MGSRFTGALAFAGDITLLAPCKSALSILVSVFEKFASEFHKLFNCSKIKLLIFKGRLSNGMESGITVNGKMVNISDNVVHLEHTISSSDRESILLTAKSSFWITFTSFISNFGHTYSFIKFSLFKQFCCSFYGSPLWDLNGPGVQSLCVYVGERYEPGAPNSAKFRGGGCRGPSKIRQRGDCNNCLLFTR